MNHGKKTGATVGQQSSKGARINSSSLGYNIITAVHTQNKADRLKQISEDIEIVDSNYVKSESVTDALDKVDGLSY